MSVKALLSARRAYFRQVNQVASSLVWLQRQFVQNRLARPPDKVKQIQYRLAVSQIAFRDPLHFQVSSSLLSSEATYAIHSDCPANPFVRVNFLYRLEPFPDVRLKECIQVESAVGPVGQLALYGFWETDNSPWTDVFPQAQ
jgi:hypothetical protein